MMTSTLKIRTTSRCAWLVVCGIGSIGLGAAPSAQMLPTGAIRGVVVDEQRAPIRTLSVTLTSPALQGQRTTLPRDDGSYGFWQLPPGDYRVTFEAPGFVTVTRTTAVLQGLGVELSLILREEGAAGGPPQVAETPATIAGPALGAHFGHDEIASLAVPRTLLGIAQLAPGLTTQTPNSGPVSINGGFAFDNVFTVNGVDVSDDLRGTPQNLFIEDAIEDTSVRTSGLPADYGRFTGGIVSAITKSGGNRYSGSYRANLSNPTWTTQTPLELCDAAVTLASCQKAAPRPDALHASHEGTLGGFVIRDRLWFFGAGRLEETSSTSLLPLSGVADQETASNQRGQIKITGAVAPGHTVTFDAATNLTKDSGRPAFAYTADPNAVGKQTIPNYYYLTNYHAAIGRRALVEAQFSRRQFEVRNEGAISRTITDSPILARTILAAGSPAHYNAPYFDVSDPEKRNGSQFGGSVTYLLPTANAGRHEIKGGYEFFRRQHVGGDSQSATGYVFRTDYLTNGLTAPALDASSRFIPLWVPGATLVENWLPTRGATLNADSQSIHIQDHWTLNGHWSADLGLRQERTRSTGTGAFDGVDASTILPRLAVGYAVDERGTQVVHATYGHYAGRYPEIPLGRNTAVGNPDVWLGVYFGPPGQGRSFAPGFDPSNYLTVAGRFPTANVSIDEGLAAPVVREFTASYGISLLEGKGFVQSAFVWRNWSHFIEDGISVANGTTHVIKNGFDVGTLTNVVYQNDEDAVREYQALEFQARYSATPHWTVNGSYTVQLRDDGNYSGEGVDTPGSTGPLGDYPEVFSAARHFPNGRLATFERHRIRAWSTYDLDLGRAGTFSLSGLVRADSGRSFSLTAVDQPLSAIQTARLLAAGYPDQPTNQTIFFGDRGSQRFSGYGVVDLAFGYSVPLFKGARPWLKLEIYNALNNQKLIAWDTTVRPDNASPADTLGLRTGYLPAATFGKATSNDDFPAPFPGESGGRTFRVAGGFRF